MPADNRLDLKAAAKRSGRSVITLRRYIKVGRLPAVKDGPKIYVTATDLDTAVAPIPMAASDRDLKRWAHNAAASAPPFRAEQRAILVTTFTSSLGDA